MCAYICRSHLIGREALTRVNLWGNFGGGNKKAESTSSSKVSRIYECI